MKISMRKLALGLAVLSTLVVLAGVGGYFFLYPSGLGAEMAAQLSRRIGQPVVFPAPARLVLWPNPRIVFDDVRIGPEAKPLVTIARMKIPTTFSALAAGTVAPDGIVVEGVHITLAQDAQGNGTWKGTVAPDLAPVTVRIREGTLALEGVSSGSQFVATGLEGTVTFAKGGLDANGSAVWNGQPVQAKVFLGSLDRLGADGSPAAITLAAPVLGMVFEGRLGLRSGLACVGIATITAKDLRALLAWAGLPMGGTRGLRNVTVSGPVDYSQGTLMLKDDALAFDGAIGRGTLLVSSSAEGPSFSGSLDLDRLNIDTWQASGNGAPWDQQIVSFAELSGFRADLAINARSLVVWKTATGPASMMVKVSGSRLDLDLPTLSLSRGLVTARLGLFRERNIPKITLDAQARGVEVGGLFSHLSGLVDGKATLATEGKTGEEMISWLGGTASANIQSGSLPGIDLKAIVLRAAGGGVMGWGASPQHATVISDLAIATDIRNGIFSLANSGVTVAGLPIAISGKIDALRRAIDLTLSPKLPAGPGPAGQTSVTDLHASGPWAAPKFIQKMRAPAVAPPDTPGPAP